MTSIDNDRVKTRRRPIRGAAVVMFMLGVAGFIVGMFVVQSLTADLRSSLSVSRSAMQTISDTVDVAADLGEGASDALRSAALAATGASVTTRDAATGLADVAEFLENDLPNDIDAIQRALPGVVGAADAIDSTLGALSLFGLDYSPDEPFGQSMRRIDQALTGLPDQVRAQSESLGALSPSADAVATDLGDLALELDGLAETLTEIDGLTEAYSRTVVEAETAVASMQDSVDRTVLYLRILLAVGALGAIVVGYALLSIDRLLTDKSPVHVIEHPSADVVDSTTATFTD